MPQHDKRLWREISGILLHQWDPIGVGEVPECIDEYDSYVPGVYALVLRKPTIAEIMAYLARLETDEMCLQRTDADTRNREVAEKVLALRK